MNRFEPHGEFRQFEPLSEMTNLLDQVIVQIPCYEPAGLQIPLDGRTLAGHVLITGATGSGKTTSVIRWLLKQLIQGKAGSAKKAGLFVFDFNGDDTVPMVTKWAREAGRESDLRVLSTDRGYLDLFADIGSLEQLSTATSNLMHGPWASLQGENAYWAETTRILFDAGLTVCFAVEGRLVLDTVLRFLTNWLVAKQISAADDTLLTAFDKLCYRADECGDMTVANKLRLAKTTFDMWAKLDPRTKSILTSMVLDALGPVIAPETRRYLDSSRSPIFVPEELTEGLIMVFSLPAAIHLESAALLGKILKARLWTSLQKRPQDQNQRLCAVVADEYHYLASGGSSRASDVTALATLRSRSVAVVAATQSLDHLASVMSDSQFRSLLPNFNTHFFFRSMEPHTAALATAIMGTHEVVSKPTDASAYAPETPKKPKVQLICPSGALARLEPCQAFVSTAAGYRSPGPVWLAANHERPDSVLQRPKVVTQDSLEKLRHAVLTKPQAPTSPPTVDPKNLTLIDRLPHPIRLLYDVATWNRLLAQRRFQRSPFGSFRAMREAFAAMGQQPAGLDSLPPCWWEALVTLTARFIKSHPLTLLGLHQQDGCLIVLLGSPNGNTEVYLNWITELERSLYPIRTRQLKWRDLEFLTHLDEEESPFFEPHDDDRW